MLLQVSVKKLNRRSSVPASFSDKSNIIGTVNQGFRFEGEEVTNISNTGLGKWYKDASGSFYWGGGLLLLAGKIISNFKDLPINLPSHFKFGIDISHHNQKPDWPAFKNAGCEFVFIKISEGTGTPDEMALIHAQNAKAQGFKIGYYHFCRPDRKTGGTAEGDARAEANDALSRMVNLPGPDLPLVLDLENENSPLAPKEYLDWINAFIDTVSTRVSKGVMIYSRKEFLDRHLPHNHNLGRHKLWISRYPIHPDASKVDCPIGWADWSAWQYKENGIIGSSAALDLNILKDPTLF